MKASLVGINLKAPEALRALGLEGIDKSERALAELRAKGVYP